MGGVDSKEDPCQKSACAIQKCLAANNYHQEACVSYVQALMRCCERNAARSNLCEPLLANPPPLSTPNPHPAK
ncbi:hypothetical protein NP493_67g03041 [Ridgeia piscesae]|uniref:Cx9C motif-containing protein 4 n=1 Tax=Ridgeia piscesae TaxID=27915 RepID=A0AAD9PA09_RIDPI|nr:hypothetical protein NP493_67g03041 [Ridgeia piscesae]